MERRYFPRLSIHTFNEGKSYQYEKGSTSDNDWSGIH
jgi:hypothetical protein